MLSLEGASVLVTGGAGFVGGNLVKRLLQSGVSAIHIVDNFLSSERINVPGDDCVYLSDRSITDPELLASLRDEYDFIFHLACYHGNQNSIANPLEDHDNNTSTTLKLYETIHGFRRLRKVIYSGAGCAVAARTFDTATATVESDLVRIEADSPYSMSKLFGEFYANYYHSRHRLPVVRARFQNVYGPGEILGAGAWRGTYATVWRNVVPTFVYKALKNLPLPVENQGIATRDFIYVDDIVTGLLACALKGDPGQAYNLASGRETSILELAETINRITENASGITSLPARDWDRSGRRFGDTTKSRDTISFSAAVELEEGLGKTVEWTRHNIDLIERSISKHATRMPELNNILTIY